MTCPHCAAPLEDGALFCESCGKPVSADAPALDAPPPVPEAAPGDDLGSGPISTPTRITPAAPAEPTERLPCTHCGGEVGPDGYCQQCGTKALSERDHFREAPAAWVAGVCDKGIRHHRNEDAMALLASPTPGERAVLVVLDGVSNTDDSHLASLAGARAAREVLRTPLPRGMGTPDSQLAAVTSVFTKAVEAANAAVVAHTPEGSTKPPSATFVAAILENGLLSYANVGDSRAYWLPDGLPGQQLSADDSDAQRQMESGVAREVAESSATAHAITKWLGQDAHDIVPRVGQLQLTEPGWVLVCSDGLWNYASTPEALVAQIAVVGSSEPAALALALTDFANASGGQDNITTVFARVEVSP